MEFSLEINLDLLRRTPDTLRSILLDLPDPMLKANEGPETWTPHEILRHLIYCEDTDWIPRMDIILQQKNDLKFDPFDRFAHLKIHEDSSIRGLLDDFQLKREKNLEKLQAIDWTEEKWKMVGIHPEFGEVTLKQLISAWTTHDLSHISQICRVVARQFKDDVGPWTKYMRILNQ